MMSQLANCPGFSRCIIGALASKLGVLDAGDKWEKTPWPGCPARCRSRRCSSTRSNTGSGHETRTDIGRTCLRPRCRRGKGRGCGLPESSIRGRRLDRHSGDDRVPRKWCSKPWAMTPVVNTLAVPVTYASLKNEGHRCVPRQLDAEHDGRHQPLSRGQVGRVDLGTNLDDAGYGLVVPAIRGRRRSEEPRRPRRPQGQVRRQDLRHRGGQ